MGLIDGQAWEKTYGIEEKLNIPIVSQRSEQLVDFLQWYRKTEFNVDGRSIEDVVDEYQKSTNCG